MMWNHADGKVISSPAAVSVSLDQRRGPRTARSGAILSTLLALTLAGCQTIKPLPPTGRVIPCSTVAPVNVNEAAIDHLSERAARQILGNDRVIEAMCARKK